MHSISCYTRKRILLSSFLTSSAIVHPHQHNFHTSSSVHSAPHPLPVQQNVDLTSKLNGTSKSSKPPSELEEYQHFVNFAAPITQARKSRRANSMQVKFDLRQEQTAEKVHRLLSKLHEKPGEGKDWDEGEIEDRDLSQGQNTGNNGESSAVREAPEGSKSKKKGKGKAQREEQTDPEGFDKKAGRAEKRKRRKLAQKTKKEALQALTTTAYTKKVEGFLGSDSTTNILADLEPPTKQNPVARLAHGLDRVLFNPGVYWLRDPRSRVYNFHPAIETIPKVFDFAFERLTGFVKSSRDEDLWELAKREKRTFGGSTSSLSGMLCQIYFMLSDNKGVDLSMLSKKFQGELTAFTPGQRMAASVVFNHKDGRYAIDSYSDNSLEAEKNILTWMGTLLEKYLTMSPEEFVTYMRTHAERPVIEDDKASDGPVREAYRYSKSNAFVMRSQLDCQDPRLPGTGVFDIKTRACLPIRMDLLNFEESSGYLINKRFGLMESFEREYCDLIRAAFLKYSFQVRIGNMDGVFVAYHNTERLFGFQYVSVEEMDQQLFSKAPGAGDVIFNKCVQMMEIIAEEIVKCYPQESVRCTFETEENSNKLHVWVEPVEPSEAGPTIKELVVTTQSFLDDRGVIGREAIHNCTDQPWNVYWKIRHMNDSEEEMHVRLKAAKERQFRAYSLPSGVSHSTIKEWWEKLNFGKKKEKGLGNESNIEKQIPEFFHTYFQEPDRKIELLRSIAKQGRLETQKLEQEERGKPKIVYGLGEVHLDEETEVQKIKESFKHAEPKVESGSKSHDVVTPSL
ncbi:hypothetical protein AAF712_008387 [Marasmius tenuissimus]|uniref:Pet127-domain-containing protein n=1 Tax=Marasmius tenuissimus TaxID=585030 RepID=A0ABR2ZV67_9AGAR